MTRHVLKHLFLFVIVISAYSLFALERQNASVYHARRVALSQKTNGGVVVLFAPTERPDEIFGFHQESNFYYLTGWTEPGAALIIAPAIEAKKDENGSTPGRAYTEILFLPARNLLQERWLGPKLGPGDTEVTHITGFERVEQLDKMHDELAAIASSGRASVYSDLGDYNHESNSVGPLAWLQRGQAFGSFAGFDDVKKFIGQLRTTKDQGELDLIVKATRASMAGHVAALKSIHPGTTEREIQALMQYEYQRRGCERSAYAPIVGSGLNSTVLHYSDDSATMQTGDVVLMDVAGEYSMYASDITRTAPVNGHFTPRQREIYNIVLGAQQAAMQAFKAGTSHIGRAGADSLDKVARDYIDSHGKDLHGASLGKYFIHGLGHYVGLDVHDEGDYTMPLDKGSVFTIEPGIYIPEEKLGIRIEDIYYVDQQGNLVQITKDLPHTAEDIETAMKAPTR
ncbi:MAG TPA: Xaa-Pro peptidase family protein [Terriglobales bacterium]|nr:Xaa-Pro peptidase family protein [Terriglobales bacterium]